MEHGMGFEPMNNGFAGRTFRAKPLKESLKQILGCTESTQQLQATFCHRWGSKLLKLLQGGSFNIHGIVG
jgi:hypothetical protein